MDFEARVLDTCSRLLRDLGFVRKGTVFMRQVEGDTSLWLGLPRTEKHVPGFVAVNPVIGLRNARLQAAYEGILALPASDSATVSKHLSSLCEKKPYSWLFSPTEDLSDPAGEVMRDIQTYGLPYVEAKASLRGVAELLDRPSRMADESERLAIAYALLGADDLARRELGRLHAEDADFEADFIAGFTSMFGISLNAESCGSLSRFSTSSSRSIG